MKKAFIAIVAMLLAVTIGCGSKSAEKALEDKSLTKVMEQAAKDEYNPPSDGKLTDKQMDMYIAVKKREAELAQVSAEKLKATGEKIEKQGEGVRSAVDAFKAMGDVANFLTADIRAAQELGYNTKEFEWVKGQILAAFGSSTVMQMQLGMTGLLEKQIAEMKAAKAKAPSGGVAESYDVSIKSLEEQLAQAKAEQGKDEEPGLKENVALLEKYKDRINVLEAELKKYQTFEKKEGTKN